MTNFFKNNVNLVIFSILSLFAILIILYEAQFTNDFNIFLSASKDTFEKKNIYKILYNNNNFHYFYSVFLCILFYPLTLIPLYFAKVLWLFFNLFLVYRIFKIFDKYLPIKNLNHLKKIFIVLFFVFILRFLRDNFHLAQMTIFIFYLSLEGLNLINNNKKIHGAFLIALGIDIKLLPLLLIPYLIYRNQNKTFIYIIIFIFILLFIPSLFVGHDYNLFLISERWNLINPFNKEHILDTTESSFQSITALLSTLLVENSGEKDALELKRNIADISLDNLSLIINIIRLMFLTLTLYFLKTFPFKKSKSNVHTFYEISYLFLIIPLIFPHQQHYAFFFIAPAIFYVLYFFIFKYYLIKEKSKFFILKKIIFIISLIFIYFLTNSHFILGEYNRFYDHYKTLTYGVLLLIILLLFCNPNKIKNNSQFIES